MNEREENLHRDIRRILVALDASTHSLAALQTAVNLAAELEAELEGLFVEDINLLRLAELPFAREVRTLSAVTQRVSRQRIEAELRAQAARARRALVAAARQAQVPATFRVVRGHVPLEVLAAALEADLLTLGRVSRPLSRRVHLGSTARMVVARAPRSVLLMQYTPARAQSIMVTYDGSALARRALATAASLDQVQPNGHLTVLLVAEEPALMKQLQEEAALWLGSRGLTAEYHWLGRASVQNLAQTVQESRCNLLVLGAERVQMSEEAIQSLLDSVDCSLMLIR